jgi:hypothetical protein
MESHQPQAVPVAERRSLRFLLATICLFLGAMALNSTLNRKAVLGATADVVELQSGLTLKARVDTGASISSLHCKQIEITDPAEEPEENSGKKVRFLLEGPDGKSHWLESTILGFAGVRNASGTSGRYRVRLRLSCRGIEKGTLVSLNDRSEMQYPLLLGRDFLSDDFIVDVSRDNPDFR